MVAISSCLLLRDMADAFIRAAASGQLPADVAAQLVSAVGTLARVVEIDELKVRLAALESYNMLINRAIIGYLNADRYREKADAFCMGWRSAGGSAVSPALKELDLFGLIFF